MNPLRVITKGHNYIRGTRFEFDLSLGEQYYLADSKIPYPRHLSWAMDRTLCYVNKEYNLGILKAIILLLKS